MLALSVPEEHIKGFMAMLLKEAVFDRFELRSATIRTFAAFEIDGTADAADLSAEEQAAGLKKYCLWETMRPYVFQIIRGGKRPQMMKFVFALQPEAREKISPDAAALFLNVMFENETITITTGVAQKNFSLDKTLEHTWDDYVRKFMRVRQITAIDVA